MNHSQGQIDDSIVTHITAALGAAKALRASLAVKRLRSDFAPDSPTQEEARRAIERQSDLISALEQALSLAIIDDPIRA